MKKAGALAAFFTFCLYGPATVLPWLAALAFREPAPVHSRLASGEFRVTLYSSSTPSERDLRMVRHCIPGQQVATTQPARVRVDQSAAEDLLVCSMTFDATRFCDPAERRALASDLSAFVSAQRPSGSSTALDRYAVHQALSGASMSSSENGIVSGRRPQLALSLTVAIRRLAEAGVISRRDFDHLGSGVPSEISAHLVDAKRWDCR